MCSRLVYKNIRITGADQSKSLITDQTFFLALASDFFTSLLPPNCTKDTERYIGVSCYQQDTIIFLTMGYLKRMKVTLHPLLRGEHERRESLDPTTVRKDVSSLQKLCSYRLNSLYQNIFKTRDVYVLENLALIMSPVIVHLWFDKNVHYFLAALSPRYCFLFFFSFFKENSEWRTLKWRQLIE